MVKSAKLSGSDEYQLPGEQKNNNVVGANSFQSKVPNSEGINDSLQGLDTNGDDPYPEGYSLSQASGKCEETEKLSTDIQIK